MGWIVLYSLPNINQEKQNGNTNELSDLRETGFLKRRSMSELRRGIKSQQNNSIS